MSTFDLHAMLPITISQNCKINNKVYHSENNLINTLPKNKFPILAFVIVIM